MHRNTTYCKTLILVSCFINFYCWAQKNKVKLVNDFNINLGVTTFIDPFFNNGYNKDFPLVSKAGMLGFEYYNKKYTVSLEYKKAYWLSLSPSNYQSPVSGIGNYDYYGITKYFNVSTKRKIYFNVGYAYIRENGYRIVPTRFKNNLSPAVASGKYNYFSNFVSSLTTYTSEGPTLAVGTNISNHFFVDLRANYYTAVHNPFFIKGLNINRVQLSVYYKFNKQR